jgi:hypothetical protein
MLTLAFSAAQFIMFKLSGVPSMVLILLLFAVLMVLELRDKESSDKATIKPLPQKEYDELQAKISEGGQYEK